MMGDYIERQMAIDAIGKAMPEPSTPDFKGVRDYEAHIACEAFSDAAMIIKNISPAKVRPVVHGKWEYNEFGCYCSACHEYALNDEHGPHKTSYCPECGADMMEE